MGEPQTEPQTPNTVPEVNYPETFHVGFAQDTPGKRDRFLMGTTLASAFFPFWIRADLTLQIKADQSRAAKDGAGQSAQKADDSNLTTLHNCRSWTATVHRWKGSMTTLCHNFLPH